MCMSCPPRRDYDFKNLHLCGPSWFSLVTTLRLFPSHPHHPVRAAYPHRLFTLSMTVHPWPCSASLSLRLSSWSLSVCLSSFSLSLSTRHSSTASPRLRLAICVLWISIYLFLSKSLSLSPHSWLLLMSRNEWTWSVSLSHQTERTPSRTALGAPYPGLSLLFYEPPPFS